MYQEVGFQIRHSWHHHIGFLLDIRDVLSVLPRRLWSCTFLNVNLLWYPCTSWSALETLAHSQTSLCFSRPEILASHKIQRSTDLQPRHHFSTPCRPPGSICRPPGSKSSQTQKTSNGSADLHCCTTPTKRDVLIFKKNYFSKGWLVIAKLKSLSLFFSLLLLLKEAFDIVKIEKWKVKVVLA